MSLKEMFMDEKKTASLWTSFKKNLFKNNLFLIVILTFQSHKMEENHTTQHKKNKSISPKLIFHVQGGGAFNLSALLKRRANFLSSCPREL